MQKRFLVLSETKKSMIALFTVFVGQFILHAALWGLDSQGRLRIKHITPTAWALLWIWALVVLFIVNTYFIQHIRKFSWTNDTIIGIPVILLCLVPNCITLYLAASPDRDSLDSSISSGGEDKKILEKTGEEDKKILEKINNYLEFRVLKIEDAKYNGDSGYFGIKKIYFDENTFHYYIRTGFDGNVLYQRLHVFDNNKIDEYPGSTQFYGLFLKNKVSDLVISEILNMYVTEPHGQDEYVLYLEDGLLFWRHGTDFGRIYYSVDDVKRYFENPESPVPIFRVGISTNENGESNFTSEPVFITKHNTSEVNLSQFNVTKKYPKNTRCYAYFLLHDNEMQFLSNEPFAYSYLSSTTHPAQILWFDSTPSKYISYERVKVIDV
jgi:hypothetical protein